MIRFLLFGTELPIEKAVRRLGDLTGQDVRPWHNEYWGDYYATLGPSAPQLRLIENEPDLEGHLPEKDFPGPAVLVYVSEPTPEVEAALHDTDWLEVLRIDETP